MYYDDHSPPHFHAYYGGQRATFSIERLQVTSGELPRRVRAMIVEWAMGHRDALMENWRLAELHEPLDRIMPPENC